MHARLWKTPPATPDSASFASLPIDVLAEIAKLLPVEDLFPFLLTNKTTWRLYKENRLDIPCIKIPGIDEGSFFHANFKDDGATLMKVYFQEQQLHRKAWASRMALAGNIVLWPTGIALSFAILLSLIPLAMKMQKGHETQPTDFALYMGLVVLSCLMATGTMLATRSTIEKLGWTQRRRNYYNINDSLERLKRSLRNNQPTQFKFGIYYDPSKYSDPTYIISSRPIFRK